MPDLVSVMSELKSKASEKTRATYVRHGAPAEKTLGVSVADMKTIVKTIRKQQALACELYATEIFDAMYLAGMVADGAQMTAAQLQTWAEATRGMTMLSEHTVPWVAVESPAGHALAREWIDSGKEHVAGAGWRTLAGVATVTPDEKLDLAEIEATLRSIPGRIGSAANRVRYTMNGYVISIGSYVAPLYGAAVAGAKQLGRVPVDVGDTACEVPVAEEYIAKVHAKGATAKRKTIRC